MSRKKLKARGCRNAFVSDANCKGMRVGGLRGCRREAANAMPMLEALKHRQRYGCEFRGGLLHAELSIHVGVVISNRKVL